MAPFCTRTLVAALMRTFLMVILRMTHRIEFRVMVAIVTRLATLTVTSTSTLVKTSFTLKKMTDRKAQKALKELQCKAKFRQIMQFIIAQTLMLRHST